jgi:tetratricopeptide (TPR) repeat protein
MKITGLLIMLVMFFPGSYLYAQGQQTVDTNLHKAQEFENLGEYLRAAEMYEDSAQVEKDSPDPIKSNIVTDLNQAAYYYTLAGQYKTATKKIEEALQIGRKLKREDIVADCLNRFGYFYNYLNKYDVAIKYYLEALDIYRKLGLEEKISNGLNNIRP